MSIEAMKQALEALNTGDNEVLPEDYGQMVSDAITALRAAIEEAQEPVAWMYHGIRHDDTPHERPSLIWKPEYMDAMSAEKGVKATPLYTAPREWQGLTKREFLEAVDGLEDLEDCWVAIQAKLKEKNG